MRRKRRSDDLDQDIREHIEVETRENIDRGMSAEEARHAALLKFGNVTRVKEDVREVWSIHWLELLMQDARFSVRTIRKNPGFTVTAVITLTLAIGANAVVFSILNALVLKPLDVPHPERLYTIDHGRNKSLAFSFPDYADLRDQNRTFSGLAAYTATQAGLGLGSEPTRAFVDEVSSNYFDVFGIQPFLGRFFHSDDEHGPNSAPYIVLNYAYWHSHFQGDRGVIGRTVQLNKNPFTIIGVAPPGFHGPVLFFTEDFFVPIVNQEQVEGQNTLKARASTMIFMTVGRLKPGVTPQQAIGDLNSIGAYLEKTYDAKVKFGLARPALFGEFGGPATRGFLSVLMVLAGLILLAACTNLGSLFCARTADRTRELAMRLSLGASRARILRGLSTEALLISAVGGVSGLGASAFILSGLSAWRPIPQFPVQLAVALDPYVYAIALVLTVLSGLLFGAAPMRQVFQLYPSQAIKSADRSPSRGVTFRDLLLVAQIGICAVLITSATVAVRGMVRSLHADFGFDPKGSMLLDTNLTMAAYRGEAVPRMQKRMLEAMENIPGVTAVGLADRTPLNGTLRTSLVFASDATDLKQSNAVAYVPTYNVSPGYFQAAATPVLSGRGFSWHDGPDAPRVAVVHEEFALQLFGSVSKAAGNHYRLQDGTRVEVVGVVENGKYQNLSEKRELAMFFPILQSPSSSTTLVVRSKLDSPEAAAAMRRKLAELDSGLPCLIQTWSSALGVSLFAPRMATIALGVLGAMAAMLSVTGIFGLAAYSVSRRLKELGIRMALGAQRRDVLSAALGRAFKLLAIGSTAGLVLGVLASRVLGAIVYDATPRDPVVLAAVVLSMAALGLLATWIPAQRALSLHPSTLLRDD